MKGNLETSQFRALWLSSFHMVPMLRLFLKKKNSLFTPITAYIASYRPNNKQQPIFALKQKELRPQQPVDFYNCVAGTNNQTNGLVLI